MKPQSKTETQPMSETNVGANLMFALRTKTTNEPISKKQCIWVHGSGARSQALPGNEHRSELALAWRLWDSPPLNNI